MVNFFLSYTRDNTEIFARKFFLDLCEEVRNLAGLGRHEVVGFMDVEGMQPGQPWPTSLQHALGQCNALVALTSPNFYRSEYCGKEVRVFVDRMKEYEEEHRVRPVAYFPVRWDKIEIDDTPELVRDFQLYAGRPSDSIDKYGVRMAVKLRRGPAYIKFVYELADNIVKATRAHPLPPSTTPPLDRVKALFGNKDPKQPVDDSVEWDRRADFVHVVIASASSRDLVNVRKNRTYYGQLPEDWMPYEPAQPIAALAAAVMEMDPNVASSGVVRIRHLPDLLAWAKDNRQVVIVIVDAWSSNLTHNREPLNIYEENRQPGTAVMIPWSRSDDETQQYARRLKAMLNQSFPQRRRDRQLYRDDIFTYHAFSKNLRNVLVAAQNRIYSAGSGLGGTAGGPPSLSAP